MSKTSRRNSIRTRRVAVAENRIKHSLVNLVRQLVQVNPTPVMLEAAERVEQSLHGAAGR